jgi:hypothetical protein
MFMEIMRATENVDNVQDELVAACATTGNVNSKQSIKRWMIPAAIQHASAAKPASRK